MQTVKQLAIYGPPHPTWEITPFGQDRGVTPEWLGFIPMFLNADDPRPAAVQIDEAYAHGGGWRPLDDGKWTMDPNTHDLAYNCGPDDPPELYRPLATAKLRAERLFFYDCAWVAIVQPDGSFQVARLD